MTASTRKTTTGSPLAKLRDEVAGAVEAVAERLRGGATHLEGEPKSRLMPDRTPGDALLERVEDVWPAALPQLRFPAVDVENGDSEVVVTADVPGFDEKSLDVEATPTRLVIRGRASRESESKEGGVHRRSMSSSSFTRAVDLPAEVKTDKVSAKCRNGVLTVRLPKTPEAKSRRVKVHVD